MTKTGAKSKPIVLCPYCGALTQCVPDTEVYQRSYSGWVWLCRPCKAWVGCHKGSKNHIPLGRLATDELRKMKIEAHGLLDPLWRAAMKYRGWSQSYARGSAYAWLSKKMGIDRADCHVGMFDEARCRIAIEILKKREPASDAIVE